MPSSPSVHSSWRARESATGYLFIAPAVILTGMFGIFPVFFTVYVSLWKWRILRGTFLGLANYVEIFGEALPLVLLLAGIGCIVAAVMLLGSVRARRAAGRAVQSPRSIVSLLGWAGGIAGLAAGIALLAWSLPAMYDVGDKEMLDSLRVTIWYSAGTVPVQLGAGLVLAVLINQRLPGRQAFRVVYLLPYVVPLVASAAVFERLFSLRTESLANQVLRLFGIPPQEWLHEAAGLFALLSGGRLPEEAATSIGTYWLGWARGFYPDQDYRQI